jgi:hypothetical protein
MLGTSTSDIEVTHVSRRGIWLLLGDEELHAPFTEFPWFAKATIEQISVVERPTSNHLNWSLLDVDLSVESLRNPAQFPLLSKAA